MPHFVKMNGNGNDFVIIDSRNQDFKMTPKLASWIAYRRFGIGCDQVIVLENSQNADVFMRIYNSDGSESGACGNATRCIAELLRGDKAQVSIETKAGILIGVHSGEHEISVDMGEPALDWKKIPLLEELGTLALPISLGPLTEPMAVSMGNPHMVFFVEDISTVDIAKYGPRLEKHPLFPERANVSVCQIIDTKNIKMKTWERGVGRTLSCGTAACAALVAAVVHEKVEPKCTIEQPGGKLTIEWLENGHVMMSGKVAKTFSGEFNWDLDFQK